MITRIGDMRMYLGDCLEVMPEIADDSMEGWVKIPSHEDYIVNKYGDIYFLGRLRFCKNGSKKQYPPRECKKIATKSGYMVSIDGQTKSVARIMAELFIPKSSWL